MSGSSDSSISNRNWIIVLVVLVIVVVVAILWGRDRFGKDAAPALVVDSAPATRAPDLAAVEDPAPLGRAGRRWAEITGETPVWPEDFAAPASCDAVQNELARICVAIDLRIPELGRQGGSCTLIEQMGSELAAAPPDLSSELRSYETLLQNVFHLFRVAGRERLGFARRVLAEEDLAEPAALTLYRWAVSHERCSRTGRDALGRSSLYAYSGFLFNTLGGQAYLRRRSPRVEALVCFFGLEALDGAIREGHNPQGLDPRPEIPRCRELVAASDFVFEERYLAQLDAMSARWDKRGS